MEKYVNPRKEYELTDGWTFSLDKREESAFRPVRLPHDWAIGTGFDRNMGEGASQGFRNRFGIGWYRRDIRIPKKIKTHRYLLSFGGIYENSTVWVNGREAGGRKYGYSSFSLDITELLKDGVNQVEIKVDNTHSPSDRWYSGAGIYRTVKLIVTEQKHLEPWEVIVHSQISGRKAYVSVDSGLKGAQIRAALTDG